MKTICSRARRLKITTSLYGPSKGSRAVYCLEKISRSMIRGVESGNQVIRRGAISSFLSYYLWEFGSFLCFFSFVVSLLCNPNKILQGTEETRILSPPIISPSVALELKGYLCHKLHLAISPSILHRFSRSQWLRKALEKTFRSVPVTSRGDQ